MSNHLGGILSLLPHSLQEEHQRHIHEGHQHKCYGGAQGQQDETCKERRDTFPGPGGNPDRNSPNVAGDYRDNRQHGLLTHLAGSLVPSGLRQTACGRCRKCVHGGCHNYVPFNLNLEFVSEQTRTTRGYRPINGIIPIK